LSFLEIRAERRQKSISVEFCGITTVYSIHCIIFESIALQIFGKG